MLVLAYEVDKVENMEDKRLPKKKYIGSWGQKDEIGKDKKIGSNLAVNTPFGPLRDKIHRDDMPKRQ